MKPNDVKPSAYIDFSTENNDTGCRFKVGDHVRISKDMDICDRRP